MGPSQTFGGWSWGWLLWLFFLQKKSQANEGALRWSSPVCSVLTWSQRESRCQEHIGSAGWCQVRLFGKSVWRGSHCRRWIWPVCSRVLLTGKPNARRKRGTSRSSSTICWSSPRRTEGRTWRKALRKLRKHWDSLKANPESVAQKKTPTYNDFQVCARCQEEENGISVAGAAWVWWLDTPTRQAGSLGMWTAYKKPSIALNICALLASNSLKGFGTGWLRERLWWFSVLSRDGLLCVSNPQKGFVHMCSTRARDVNAYRDPLWGDSLRTSAGSTRSIPLTLVVICVSTTCGPASRKDGSDGTRRREWISCCLRNAVCWVRFLVTALGLVTNKEAHTTRTPRAVRWAASDATDRCQAVDAADRCQAVDAADIDWTQPTKALNLVRSLAEQHRMLRRTLRRRHLRARLRDACEAKRSLVQEGKSAHFKWQRVFGHGSPAVLLRLFHVDIFDLVDTQERARLVCGSGARSSANWFFPVLIWSSAWASRARTEWRLRCCQRCSPSHFESVAQC